MSKFAVGGYMVYGIKARVQIYDDLRRHTRCIYEQESPALADCNYYTVTVFNVGLRAFDVSGGDRNATV